MSDLERLDEALEQPITFYAVVNDVIGGWDVSEFNKPVADHGKDEHTIGAFMSEEWATRVADALNRDVRRIVVAARTYRDLLANGPRFFIGKHPCDDQPYIHEVDPDPRTGDPHFTHDGPDYTGWYVRDPTTEEE